MSHLPALTEINEASGGFGHRIEVSWCDLIWITVQQPDCHYIFGVREEIYHIVHLLLHDIEAIVTPHCITYTAPQRQLSVALFKITQALHERMQQRKRVGRRDILHGEFLHLQFTFLLAAQTTYEVFVGVDIEDSGIVHRLVCEEHAQRQQYERT